MYWSFLEFYVIFSKCLFFFFQRNRIKTACLRLFLAVSGNAWGYVILKQCKRSYNEKKKYTVDTAFLFDSINVCKLLLCLQHWCVHSFPLIIVELNNSTKSFFPTEYLKLKENFQKSNSAKWPLPSCKKAFRVFEGKFFNFSLNFTQSWV